MNVSSQYGMCLQCSYGTLALRSNSLIYKKMKNSFIILAFVIIMFLNFLDVLTDISLGIPFWHIIEESIIVMLSGLCAGYLIFDVRRNNKKLELLASSLSQADLQLKNITESMRSARRHYSEIIHQQFIDWQFTVSEQQVALLLLKGLSFKEISAVRDTKEKTVRQQASSIYSKSGLDGRHTFSAWFLEDFLVEG